MQDARDEEHLDCLDGLDVFRELPDATRHDLVRRSRVTTYRKGEVLARPGDPIRSVLVVPFLVF